MLSIRRQLYMLEKERIGKCERGVPRELLRLEVQFDGAHRHWILHHAVVAAAVPPNFVWEGDTVC